MTEARPMFTFQSTLRWSAAAILALGMLRASAADLAILWRPKNIAWADTAAIKGAKHAPLWGGAGGAEEGTLHRLPINLVLARAAQPQATRIVVLSGAIGVEIDGRESGDFGPGSFIAIPAGAKHALTTSAAGECTFLLQTAVSAETAATGNAKLWRPKNLTWAETVGIKSAKHAPLWGDATAAAEGALHRLPINLVLTREGRPQVTRIVVLSGAIGVEIDGRESGDFGPGSYIAIPAGAKHALTTSAAGECMFLLQSSGATAPKSPR